MATSLAKIKKIKDMMYSFCPADIFSNENKILVK